MPIPPIIIGAGIAAAGGALSGIGSKKRAKRQHKYNKELAKYTYDQQIAMMENQRGYDNPSAQMERLKAAGLNPNLVYGTGTVAGNTSGQTPKYQQQAVEQPNVLKESIAPAVQGALVMAQIKSLTAATEKVDLENLGTKQQMGIIEPTYFQTQTTSKAGVVTISKDTRNIMYKKAKAALEQSKLTIQATALGNKVLALKARLAEQNIISTDNMILRIIMNLMEKSGYSLNEITTQLIKPIIQ